MRSQAGSSCVSNELLEGFAAHQRRRGLRAGTISRRDRFLRQLLRSVDPMGATAADIDMWLDGCNISIRSRASYLSQLGVFFAWLTDQGLRPDDPLVKIGRPRLPRMIPRPASTYDLDRALVAAGPRMRAWVCLAAYQGFRCWEIAGLRREAVLDGETPPLLLVEDGKGGKQRVLPLNPVVLDALRAYGMPAHGPMFTLNNGRPMNAGAVSAYMSRWMRDHGFPASAHNYRHWFGTTCYQRTKDLRLVQELMGHSDPRTTAGYVAWSPSDAAAVVNSLGADPA